MNKTDRNITMLPQGERQEAEKLHQQNLEELSKVVHDINRAGKMIGRPTLMADLLFRVLFVVGSMDQPGMQSFIGVTPQKNSK